MSGRDRYGDRARAAKFFNAPPPRPQTILEGRYNEHDSMHGIDAAKVNRLDGRRQSGLTFDGGGPRRHIPEEPLQTAERAPGPAKVSRGLPRASEGVLGSDEMAAEWDLD